MKNQCQIILVRKQPSTSLSYVYTIAVYSRGRAGLDQQTSPRALEKIKNEKHRGKMHTERPTKNLYTTGTKN